MNELGRSESPITVATIAGSAALRDVLDASFARRPWLQSVGTFAHIDEAVDAAGGARVDVALGFLPPRDSSSLLKWRSLFDAGTSLLFLSTYPNEREALRSGMAGAAGFVTRLVKTEEIVSSIVEVSNGAMFPSPMAATWLQQVEQGSWHQQLTELELAVAREALGGQRTAEIARKLGCSHQAVLGVLGAVSDRIDS
ncbi:MAG: hypothetical protein AB7G38_14995 [Dehalococcoidia bacterium]